MEDGVPVFPVLLLTRWLHFASVFALFGSSLFWFFSPGGFLRARRATDRLLRVAALVAAISGLGWLAAILANMAGGFAALTDPESLSLFLGDPQFGPVALTRLILLAAALGLAAWPAGGALWRGALVSVGALLLVDQAWLGHAAQSHAMIASYGVHVLAAAIWLGGLPPLLLALREARGDEARGVLLFFSHMAMIAVVAILVTGLLNLQFHHNLDPAFWPTSDYGLVLIVKSLLVGVMLALAVANRFVFMKRAAWRALRLAVAAEIVLGLLVLAAAALLGVTPPA